MNSIQKKLIQHARMVIAFGLILLIAAGAYGFGLFNSLGDSTDNFYANSTPATEVNNKVKDIFGNNNAEQNVVLFESKDRSNDARSAESLKEIDRILEALNTKTVVGYKTTKSSEFVSKDNHDTYVLVTLDGSKKEQFDALTEFSNGVNSDTFTVSVGGMLVGQEQTQEQAKADIEHAELISLPILALLLLWFFRSPIAAAVPLLMSGLTIAGALAVARIVHEFLPIDTYTLNVITILGVGLSIDYSLLAVNRFREELSAGKTAKEAALKTTRTAGRTVVFSGLTVIICLLSLMLLPVGFMQSVSIGGASAVFVAMLISTILLPPALALLGNTINKFSLNRRKDASRGWKNIATKVTKRPWLALGFGVVVIAALVWPVRDFAIQSFNWRVLPNNQSAYHVGQVMDENFDVKTPSLTVLAEFTETPTITELCTLASDVSSTEGVTSVQAAYAPIQGVQCTMMPSTLQMLQKTSPQVFMALQQNSTQYTKDNYALVSVVTDYSPNDSEMRGLIDRLSDASSQSGVTLSVTGDAARAQDTMDVYRSTTPYIIGVIVVAMLIILGLSLGSLIIPIQAVIINSLTLFISLGVLIMIFQFGWGANLLNATITNGFELSIPILVFTIAFGLSMDYGVFLYSRMHEEHDKTNDPVKSIINGVAKTGPIITSAALLLFVVVAAFGMSHIAIIQQIGFGLAIAVLVDAFFVRIIFVPAVMKLFGQVSWWAPEWLKKIVIKHD